MNLGMQLSRKNISNKTTRGKKTVTEEGHVIPAQEGGEGQEIPSNSTKHVSSHVAATNTSLAKMKFMQNSKGSARSSEGGKITETLDLLYS